MLKPTVHTVMTVVVGVMLTVVPTAQETTQSEREALGSTGRSVGSFRC